MHSRRGRKPVSCAGLRPLPNFSLNVVSFITAAAAAGLHFPCRAVFFPPEGLLIYW